MIHLEMTEAEYDEKVAELAAKGIKLVETRGEVDKEGVTVTYTYEHSKLTVQIMRKPLFVSLAYCESRMREWIAARKGSEGAG